MYICLQVSIVNILLYCIFIFTVFYILFEFFLASFIVSFYVFSIFKEKFIYFSSFYYNTAEWCNIRHKDICVSKI